MNTEIWVAIIGCFGVALTSILTTIVQLRKLRSEQEKTITESLNANRNEYLEGIASVKESINEINICVGSMQQSMNSQWALFDLRIQHLTEKVSQLETSVSSHNNFAQRLPVLEEKVNVANHRISDLEHGVYVNDGK